MGNTDDLSQCKFLFVILQYGALGFKTGINEARGDLKNKYEYGDCC